MFCIKSSANQSVQISHGFLFDLYSESFSCLNTMSVKPRWTRNPRCEDDKKLEEYFSSGEISKDDTYLTIYNHSTKFHEFKKYSIAVFKCAFNEMRNKQGVERKQHFFILSWF